MYPAPQQTQKKERKLYIQQLNPHFKKYKQIKDPPI